MGASRFKKTCLTIPFVHTRGTSPPVWDIWLQVMKIDYFYTKNNWTTKWATDKILRICNCIRILSICLLNKGMVCSPKRVLVLRQLSFPVTTIKCNHRWSCWELPNRKDTVFHQYNARPYPSFHTKQQLVELSWNVLLYLMYCSFRLLLISILANFV